MRGSNNTVVALLALGVILMGAYLVFTAPATKVIQQAAPTTSQPQVAKVQVPVWNLLVTLQDTKKMPVNDANVYLLFEKPANIYMTPTTGIYKSAIDVNQDVTFESVMTGKEYYILATANGYYNAEKDYNMPAEVFKTYVDSKLPVSVTVTMTKKGDIIGAQVPLQYRGSTADIAKLVKDQATGNYETEFQFVSGSEGEVLYNKVRIDLNTTNLGSATLDDVKVTIGDKTYDYQNMTAGKTITFDEPQKLAANSTLPVKIVVSGDGLDSVSGELFKITVYDVQSGSWSETVEGPQ